MSSAAPRPTRGLGPLEWVRWLWTQLTSMRTALSLLFLGAIAAVPGSVLPQRSIDEFKVNQFLTDNPRLGEFYDRLWLFDVYASPWFSAIYLLLLISLIGCIVPRILVYARALRARPPRVPRNLQRLPAWAGVDVVDTPGRAARLAAAHLRRRRFRVDVTETDTGAEVAAERGFSRELGNLTFHVSLVLLLIAVAVGIGWGYRGTSVVVEGQGFSNTLTQYDEIRTGSQFTERDLPPFTLAVDHLDVQWRRDGVPRDFTLRTRLQDAPGQPMVPTDIAVNHPAHVGDTTIHLLEHGYAPEITVRDGAGAVAFSGPVPFLPQDPSFTSTGVVNARDARPERIALQGFFLPTAAVDELGPHSTFPALGKPELFLTAWHGPPSGETGRPENVWTLDTTGLTQYRGADGGPLRVRLALGQTERLPDGGSVEFTGVRRFAKLQIASTPGLGFAAAAVALAIAGLLLSLFVRPRRLWVRIEALADGGADGRARVVVGGLDRAGARTGLADDVLALARAASGRGLEAGPAEGQDESTGSEGRTS